MEEKQGVREVPLSYGQQALWLLERLTSGSGVNTIAAGGRVVSGIDLETLRRALAELSSRHEVLRTTFDDSSGEVQQFVHSLLVPGLRVEPARTRDEAALQAALEREALRPFDLQNGPLFRAVVFASEDGGEDVLLLIIHHLIADFRTIVVLLRDLGELYGREGEPLGLPEVDHSDFVQWQREWIAGPEGEALWEWWREHLAGPLPQLELPADRPRGPVPSYEASTVSLRLGEELADQLSRLARKRGATRFMALYAGFTALLARLSGDEDLLIGTPTAGRRRVDFAHILGYFVNPLVLRSDVRSDPDFGELLARCRAEALAVFDHQDFPLPLLTERLQPGREGGRTPLFQVVFVLQKAERRGERGLAAFALGEPGARLDLGKLVFESVRMAERRAQFDLTLRVAEVEGDLAPSFLYRTALFEEATAERWLRGFRNLLAGAVENPERRLSELPLLDEAERAQILGEWSGPGRSWNLDQPVHLLVAERAAAHPEALAVKTPGEELTYGELDTRAEALAGQLREMGVELEDRVALLLPRSAGFVVAALAVMKAGGAYVPIDIAYPEERRELLLEDSGAKVVVTEDGPHPLTPSPGAGGWESGRGDRGVRVSNLAYLIYTSGSTGRPKGVELAHAGLLNLIGWHLDTYGLTATDRSSQTAGLGFDAAVWEIWPPLVAGASLHFPPEELRTAPEGLREWLREAAITVAFLATPLAEAILDLPGPQPESLRYLLTGGDRLHHAPPSSLPFALVNHYGPTEGTVVATAGIVPPGDGAPAIGRPMANARVYLVDRHGAPVPQGVPGELLLGGIGLARGYHGSPGLTAERFVPDPFGGDGGRLYRTGDLARWRADGQIEFLRRIDLQIKVRGFRIEPGEIEAALSAHPEVAEAAVVARQDAGSVRLIGYVVARGEAADLKSFLRQRLPEPLVPSALVFLPALPITPNGKVDRQALAALPPPAAEDEERTAPRTALEAELAEVWRDLLGREAGVHDDFFALGGHSLLAARLVSRIRERWRVELPLGAIFTAPTLAELAVEVERELGGAAEALAPIPVQPRTAGDEAPLSLAQERLWFLDRLDPGNPVYNIAGGLRLTGRLDVERLRRALAGVIRRHEALRTTFVEKDGGPVQVIGALEAVELPVVDLAEAGEPAARELAYALSRQPFDLAADRPLRAQLLKLEPESHVLFVVLHHIAADGWSLGVLLRELSAGYRGEEPAAPAVQYADFAAWQGERMADPAGEVEFWRRELAGAPRVLDLPADHRRPALQRFAGAAEPLVLGDALGKAVDAFAAAEGATRYMVLLAGFFAWLHRLSGADTLLAGSPVANRNRPEVEGLIGFFVNTLVLRADVSGSFRGLLAQMKERTLAAYAHQELPFDRLVQELEIPRDLSRTPLVQVMFAFQNAPREELDLPGLAAEPWPVFNGTAKFDLTLSLDDAADLPGWIEYASDLYEAGTVRRWRGLYAALLSAALEAPGEPVAELPWLSPAEIGQLFAAPEAEPALDLRAALRAALGRTPEALAVAGPGERWTYSELAERVASLERGLREQGIGEGDLVAVHLERSPEAVAAILGVVLSGAAYLPLDPSYPAERNERILASAPVAAVVGPHPLAPSPGLPPPAPGEGEGEETENERAGRGRPLPQSGGGSGRGSGFPSPGAGARESGRGDRGVRVLYQIFTSGSTGLPKGAAVYQTGFANLLAWYLRELDWTAEDRALVFSSLAFDLTQKNLFAPFLAGGSLHLAGSEYDPAELARTVEREGITRINCTPSAFYPLLEGDDLARLGSLRTVILGGEPIAPARLAGLPAGAEVINSYGPTECSDVVSFHSVDLAKEEVPLGRAVSGCRLVVVDRAGQLAPDGIPGELWIGGVCVGAGYPQDAALTAGRFVPDPWSAAPGERLYRTGDLVKQLADGNLLYLGRIDQQVKIRGFRIEPGEIEAALLRHPGVREVAVVVSGNQQLVAFWVAGESVPETAELREGLRAALPEAMVPAAYVLLPELPLTPSGKVDRRALSLREVELETESAADDRPKTALEESVAAIWAEVLGRVPGLSEDFFASGGHSLLAARVISRIRRQLGVELPVRALFEAPTVEKLAQRVAQAQATEAALPPIPLLPRSGPLPLSFSQERLWFLDRLAPGDISYLISGAVRLTGALSPGVLQQGLAAVAARHESLRTSFAEGANGPEQRIAPSAKPALPMVDLAALPEPAQEIDRLALAESRLPFDLTRGLLFRTLLLRGGKTDHTLLVTMHHIVSDGWSLGVLVRDLSAAVAGRALPPLPLQYADYAAWQRGVLTPEILAREVEFWRGELAGAPRVLELPLDRRRPALQSAEGGFVLLRLGEEAGDAVDRLAAASGTTRFMVLLALFFTLLRRWSGQDELLVGVPAANRDRPELEELIGFFVNTLVIRGDLTGRPSFRQLLERVRERSLAAWGHEELPFDRLVQELESERDLSRTPLVQHLFVLQNTPQEPLVLPGLEVEPRPVLNDTAKFDLTLSLDDNAALTGWIEYATALFDRATVERFARHLARLLAAAAAAPETALAALPLLDESERRELLVSGDGGPGSALDFTIDFRSAETAVVFGSERLSYRELGERVDAVAARLRELGTGPGDLVGVQLERSPALIAALLAVVQLGAAYLPLDPGYPADRLARMLGDARVAALVTADGITRQDPAGASWGGELMYVIYTSGSTGIPKGAAVYRSGFANLVAWYLAEFGWDASDRALVISSASFDLTQKNFFAPLLAGGTLYLGPAEYDPKALAATVEREGITRLNGTPSAFYPILEAGKNLGSLRSIFLGGEPIDPGRLGALRDRVVNTYGPTECSDVVTFHRLAAGEESAPLGRPVPGVLLRVVDEELELAPAGVAGELLLGGICVGAGYPRDAALTAEKFLPDPWSETPGARLYRTGDRVRPLASGIFEYLGRVDQQVKLRGFRIELGEIESALRRHPGVREAAVVVKEDRLAAFWVRDPAAETPAPADLRSHVRESLPDYMVPALYGELPELPLTPSGKVDRRALQGREGLQPAAGREFVAPRTPVEELLEEIWTGVLGLEEIGVHDNFFELGGHSLQITRVLSQIDDVFAVAITPRDFFMAPTLAQLGALVTRELLAAEE